MKIAIVTDDGVTISAHFGRAKYYMVYMVGNGETINHEMRDKAGHQDHIHKEPHEHEGKHDPRGHGFGAGAVQRHAGMIDTITDCETVLTRGMGQGAYLALQGAGIRPIITEIALIEDAVKAYVDGTIVDHPERLH